MLPGITPLLEALGADRSAFLALLTGNFADAAEVKLAHFDLWRHFRCGAFGEDAHDRNHLVPVALERARAQGLGPHVEAAHVLVIGDTPRDIACAHAHGAAVVAVATGEYTADALRAAGAEVVFDDLSETTEVLRAIGRSPQSLLVVAARLSRHLTHGFAVGEPEGLVGPPFKRRRMPAAGTAPGE